MSRRARMAAKHQRIDDPTAKLVLMALADRHNETTGACFPSIDCIVMDAGVSRQAVLQKLAFLEHQGFIAREPRRCEDGTPSSTSYQLKFLSSSPTAAKPRKPRTRKIAALPTDDWRPRPETIDRIRKRYPRHDTSDEAIQRLIWYWIDSCHAIGRRHRDFDRAWANSAAYWLEHPPGGPSPVVRGPG